MILKIVLFDPHPYENQTSGRYIFEILPQNGTPRELRFCQNFQKRPFRSRFLTEFSGIPGYIQHTPKSRSLEEKLVHIELNSDIPH